ncbi:MAG TPA: NACHT domain-containing protein, partial [Anaerolineales bacterium]|nr:NACHT domain-containing protein [Anaerolineales bacterium]
HLDFESGKGMVYLRRWSDSQNLWIEDINSYPGGIFTFPLPKDLTEQEPDTSALSIAASGIVPADTRRLQAAEQRYRDLLLESSDIINLANMPEQDRHLAQRQLELRRLYVPLRVWVEVGISQEKDELDQTDKLWESLEQRRATSLRGFFKEEQERDKRKRYPIGERLEKAQRLVVLGDPGSGKTTLTRWIATAFLLRLKKDPDFKELPDVATLPDVDWLPIIVRCRDLDGTCLNGSLDDILKHTLRKAELSDAEATDLHELLRLRLNDGKALLMLDGLDEITDSAARACFCQQLEQIVRAFPDAPIIATSRIVGYREMGSQLGQSFEHLTLADLTPEEKDDFASRWCALTELPERCTTATEELIADIHSADRIERLTGNPMLLTTMALVKRKIGKLPRRRAELYWEAVQVLLNWRREVDEPLDWHEAIPQLEYLAYAMCDLGVQQLRQDEILDMFTHMRKDYPNVHAAHNRSPEEFLKRLEARTGILIEAGRVPHLGMQVPIYEFRHLTFQEYLAARALVDGRFPNRDPKHSLAENVAPLASRTSESADTRYDFKEASEVENWLEALRFSRTSESADTRYDFKEASVVENWLEALRLCTAICSDDDVDDVLQAILTPQDGDPSSTVRARSILAALCLADEPNASEQITEQVFLSLAQQVGNHDGSGKKTNLDTAVIELTKTRWADTLRAVLLEKLYVSTSN